MLMDAEFDPVVADIRRAERKTEEEAWNDCPATPQTAMLCWILKKK